MAGKIDREQDAGSIRSFNGLFDFSMCHDDDFCLCSTLLREIFCDFSHSATKYWENFVCERE